MNAKTIIFFILGAMFVLGLPSYDSFGPMLVAVALAALFFYLGWRSMKNTKKVKEPTAVSASSPSKVTPAPNVTITSGSSASAIRTKVVGVTFKNEDGTDRQELLSCVSPGDMLDLEPYEYNGAPAMKVMHAVGCIGNLKAELAADLCKNEYITYTAEVLEVTGGEDGKSYGCNIEITEI